ncbi:MAG: hypothetical protein O3A95_07700 [Planctomycetota bacterium]|nr:hypothetical protein [Planctomycetota bacterium]MDA1114165.1 hypothetical protein [Planctomycetota bacterium]
MNLEEENELDLFAEELRSAYPQPELSEDFFEVLEARVRQSWSFRSAMQSNPLIRVAAGMLVMTIAAAPVAALFYMFGPMETEKPKLGFEPRQEYSDAGWREDAVDGDSGYTIIGPEDEFDSEQPILKAEQLRALEQASRMARVSMNWKTAQRPVPAVEQAEWSAFLAACEEGVFSQNDAQIQAFGADSKVSPGADDASRSAYAAWHWVLTGELASTAEAPLAWKGAPFLSEN